MSHEIFEYAFSTPEEFTRFLKAHFKPFDGAPRPEIFVRRHTAGSKHYGHPNPGHSDHYSQYTATIPYMGVHFAKITIDDCPVIPEDWAHYGDKKIFRQFHNKRDLIAMLRSAKAEKDAMAKLSKITASELSEVTDSSTVENDNIEERTNRIVRKGDMFKLPIEFPRFSEIKELVVKCECGSRSDLCYTVIADFQHYWDKANAETTAALSKHEFTYYRLGKGFPMGGQDD
jgi:hypothetical protein